MHCLLLGVRWSSHDDMRRRSFCDFDEGENKNSKCSTFLARPEISSNDPPTKWRFSKLAFCNDDDDDDVKEKRAFVGPSAFSRQDTTFVPTPRETFVVRRLHGNPDRETASQGELEKGGNLTVNGWGQPASYEVWGGQRRTRTVILFSSLRPN